MTTITITTETGRIINLSIEAARTLESAGVTPDQIDLDIDQVVADTLSIAGLTEACQDGAEDGATITAWQDYVTEIGRHADRELLARQAS